MKLIVIGLLALVACVETMSPYAVSYGTAEYCDPMGCREITGNYFYNTNGVLYYYDGTFGAWIGNSGYYIGNRYYNGHPIGYANYYHNYGYQHNRDVGEHIGHRR